MIEPTIGRKVWYRPSHHDTIGVGAMVTSTNQPLDATVIAVWGPRMVNLLVIDIMGKVFPKLSSTLVQEGDTPPMQGSPDKEGKPTPGGYAEWMPYQQGQGKPIPAPPPVDNEHVAPGSEKFTAPDAA